MKLPTILKAITPKTLNIIVLILGVLVLAAVLYYSCANREGFDGSVPSASQTSSIPSDTPGATTSNPTVAKPEMKDIQAALDELDAFFVLAATFNYKQSKLPVETRHSIGMYRMLSQAIRDDLKKAIETPEKSDVTLNNVTELRQKLTELSQTIRSYTQNIKAGESVSPPESVKIPPEEEYVLQSVINDYMGKLANLNMENLKKANVSTDTQFKIAYYASMGQSYLDDISSKTMTADDANYIKKTYKELSALLDSVSGIATPPAQGAASPAYEATVVAGTPGVITLKELQNLVSRIDAEHLRLANLRSTSATLLARKTQLDKLAADIRELIGAVQRKEMKLEDVPISPSSAEAFLKQMEANAHLPPLIEPRAKIADGIQAHVTPTPSPDMNGKALYGLLENAKYLKWNLEVKLEYDPKYAARDNALKRLEAIEQRLSALAVSETPISKEMYDVFMRELHTISNVVAPSGKDSSTHKYERPATAYTRSTDGATAEYPSADQMSIATSVRDSASGNAILNPPNQVSPDVFVRPGFIMNDETIQRRASASAFDDSIVGGPDYKKRSQELCRQIRGANLGEPAKFGCISNPDEVGPDYSWKGNFIMVCNRLGDTWGGWYPEMFGCPKYDPTQKFKATMM
jgi:hypothetical protein